ncbi:putative methylesterase 11, chloroplastic [Tanacetum coccineum]
MEREDHHPTTKQHNLNHQEGDGNDWSTMNRRERKTRGPLNLRILYFFTDFPQGWNDTAMWKAFAKFGRVIDVYLAKKKSTNGCIRMTSIPVEAVAAYDSLSDDKELIDTYEVCLIRITLEEVKKKDGECVENNEQASSASMKRHLHQLQQRNVTSSLFSSDVDVKHVGSNAGLLFLLATVWGSQDGNIITGDEVILVGHDFGGVCISYAMELFPTKITKAVFIVASMLKSGQSPLDVFYQRLGR